MTLIHAIDNILHTPDLSVQHAGTRFIFMA